MDQFAPNNNNRPEVPRPENLLGLVGQTLNMRRLRALQVAAQQTITYQVGIVFKVTSQSRGASWSGPIKPDTRRVMNWLR